MQGTPILSRTIFLYFRLFSPTGHPAASNALVTDPNPLPPMLTNFTYYLRLPVKLKFRYSIEQFLSKFLFNRIEVDKYGYFLVLGLMGLCGLL